MTEPAEPRATAAADQGLADGVWTEDDRQALRRALEGATPSDTHDALSHLATAINDGRVRLATAGSAF